MQAKHFSPQRPPEPSTQIVNAENIPNYCTCELSRNALENARRKRLLWVLVRLYADAKQKVSGRTGLNISVRNEVEVRQDSVGYLPTIHVLAANMSTVHSFAQEPCFARTL